MLKQLQQTPAKTFDKVNASPQAGYDLHLWAWLSDQTTKLMMENEALAAEINPALNEIHHLRRRWAELWRQDGRET